MAGMLAVESVLLALEKANLAEQQACIACAIDVNEIARHIRCFKQHLLLSESRPDAPK